MCLKIEHSHLGETGAREIGKELERKGDLAKTTAIQCTMISPENIHISNIQMEQVVIRNICVQIYIYVCDSN